MAATSTRPSGLPLPGDAVTTVCSFLGPRDLGALRATCKLVRGDVDPAWSACRDAVGALNESVKRGKQARVSLRPVAVDLSALAALYDVDVRDAEAVGRLLRRVGSVSASVRGHVMGPSEWGRAVAKAFVGTFDFATVHPFRALRALLAEVDLPQSNKSVQAFIHAVGKHWVETSRDGKHSPRPIIDCKSSAFVFLYSGIMLTTDLYAPSVRKKMSPDAYVALVKHNLPHAPDSFILEGYNDVVAAPMPVGAFRDGPPARPSWWRSRVSVAGSFLKRVGRGVGRGVSSAAGAIESLFDSVIPDPDPAGLAVEDTPDTRVVVAAGGGGSAVGGGGGGGGGGIGAGAGAGAGL